jgi:hypothetical protein
MGGTDLFSALLGITAMGGTHLSRGRRDMLAEQWADAVIALLTSEEVDGT